MSNGTFYMVKQNDVTVQYEVMESMAIVDFRIII